MSPPLSRRRRRIPENPLPFFSPFSRTISFSLSPSHRRLKPCNNKFDKNNLVCTDPKEPIDRRREDFPPPDNISKREESSEEELEEESRDEEELNEIVQVDFGFFDPKPGDFHGVKLLLSKYLDDKPWDLGGFVDVILRQTTVGTVIKSEDSDQKNSGGSGTGGSDDDDIYAVVTALNIARYSEHKCMKEVRDYVLGICRDEVMKKKLIKLFGEQASNVGLLVSQRFVNCPHQVVPPLYNALFDEVMWATEDENTHANQCNAKSKSNSDEPIIYIKVEDELFHELCSFSFTFKLHLQQSPPPELKNYKEMGLLMAVQAEKVPNFRTKLKSLLADV